MQEKVKGSALCEHGFSERNNYYFGKLMTARDFTDEQSYLNEKRWMVNRLGLGWGVLCGLGVRPHAHDKRKVVVEAGFALDPYGHEILVCREETVDLLPGLDDCPPAQRVTSPPHVASPPSPKSHRLYLSIKYEECGVNPSPIMIDSCEGYKEECVYNRTREGYRFIVSRERPDPHTPHEHGCDGQCHRRLQDPSAAISGCCPERPGCEPVPLAAICYNETTDTTVMDIDTSMSSRKLAFSNEMLFELLTCLREGAQSGWGAGHDRRQHVPLLATTIRGLKYRDGKTAALNWNNGYDGVRPYRLTSDGDYIWVTDREDRQVWRIDRATNRPVKDSRLYLDDNSWGIAFDGRYMWISHHDAFGGQRRDSPGQEISKPGLTLGEQRDYGDRQPYGRLTRVDVCTLHRLTIDGLPECHALPECYRFPEAAGAPDSIRLLPYAGEVVLHDGDIYVAHDLPKSWRRGDDSKDQHAAQQQQQHAAQQHAAQPREGYELFLTRIDPARGCIVEVISVPETDEREPLSRIQAMASDGKALWITYTASSRDRRGERAVVRRIRKENGMSVVGKTRRLNKGNVPEHIAFDGTRLWISHNDGLSIIDAKTRNEEAVNTDTAHTAIAYGGGPLLWTLVPGKNEAFVTWVDILSKVEGRHSEFIEVGTQTPFELSDMQFDGTYIYVAYHVTVGGTNRGVIHRLLP